MRSLMLRRYFRSIALCAVLRSGTTSADRLVGCWGRGSLSPGGICRPVMLAVAAVGRPLAVLGELTVLAWLWATLVVATSAGGGAGWGRGCQTQRSNCRGTPRALHMHARYFACVCVCVCVCVRVCCRRCLVTVRGDSNGSQ